MKKSRILLIVCLSMLCVSFASGQSWTFYRGDDFTGATTDWTGGTHNTTSDRYETYNDFNTWTWGNNPCPSNVTACKWTIHAYLNKNTNSKIYPQTQNSSTDNGHALIEDTGALQTVKPEPNYDFTKNVNYGWIEMNLTYNRTNKLFTYEDRAGNLGTSTFAADTQNYTYLRWATGQIQAGGSFVGMNYTYLWLPTGEYVNGSGGGGGTPITLPFNQSDSGFVSGTHLKSYYDIINKGLLQDYTGTNGSYVYDGNYLSVPKYDSSTDFDTMNTCGGKTIGTLSMDNHFVVTDELSQFGQMISMGNNETIMIGFLNTIQALNASSHGYGTLTEWCVGYQNGEWNKSMVADTASDADARIIDALFTCSSNEQFTNTTRNDCYTQAKTMSEDFYKYNILQGSWTSSVDGSTISYLGCGGSNVCSAETNNGFFYTGYVGDNAIALLKACKRTGNNTYCSVADDLILGALQASGNTTTGYWTSSSGFKTIEGIHYKWDGGNPPRAVCTNNCDQDWDYSDAPRISSLGVYEWQRVYNSISGNINLSFYLTDWVNSYDKDGVACVTDSDYGLKWYANGTCSTHQSGWYELGLGSQLLFGTNESVVYTYLNSAFSKYTNTTYKWDGTGEFGVYRQTFPVRTYGVAMGLDADSYTLFSSLPTGSGNVTLNVSVFDYGTDLIRGWNFSIGGNYYTTNAIISLTSEPDAEYTNQQLISKSTWLNGKKAWTYTLNQAIINYTKIEIYASNLGTAKLYYRYQNGTYEWSDTQNVLKTYNILYFSPPKHIDLITSIDVYFNYSGAAQVGLKNLGWKYFGGEYREITLTNNTYLVGLGNNSGYAADSQTIQAIIAGSVYPVTFQPQLTDSIVFNFFDETTKEKLFAPVNITTYVTGSQQSYEFTATNGTYTLQDVYGTDDYIITYTSEGYVQREYYFTHIAGSRTTINLFLLNDTLDTIITALVLDELSNEVSSATIKAQRKNLSGTNYYTVEMCETGFTGECILHLELYDTTYRFLVIYEGETKLSSSDQKILSSDLIFRINLGSNPFTMYDELFSISGDVSYDNTTTLYTYTWNDNNNRVVTACLKIVGKTKLIRQTIVTTCSSSDSGTLTYPITPSDYDEFTGTGYIVTTGGEEIIIDAYTFFARGDNALGLLGLFIFGFIIAGSVAFIGLWNPAVAPVLISCVLVFSYWLGFINVSSAIIGAVAVIAGIVVFMVRS